MLISGAGVITAYASGGRPGAIDADGWLDTGDLGYLDADGYLFLVGRSDDVINRGGEKIYPREIEEILLAQPGVRSAAVVGAVDEVLGERPVAYVVPDADAVAAEVEAVLRAVCAERLPRHKQPSEFWLVDEMPLGPTGKISRRLLKESVAAQLVSATAFSGPGRSRAQLPLARPRASPACAAFPAAHHRVRPDPADHHGVRGERAHAGLRAAGASP